MKQAAPISSKKYIMKNKLLKTLLSKEQYKELQAKIELHSRYSSIDFEIINIEDRSMIIRTSQDKSFIGNYFEAKDLERITSETFQPYFPELTIVVHPIAFIISPGDIITSEFLRGIMSKFKIKNKEFEAAFGIHKSSISAWVNGLRPMSKAVQGMFYYYLIHKKYIH